MNSTQTRVRELVWQTGGFPTVVDSSHLLPELCESARWGTRTREIRELLQNPFIFMAVSVSGEVDRRLPAMAMERGVIPRLPCKCGVR
jgi:hypothetical protein